MEITGKIIAVLEERSGKSERTGNEWHTQDYVIETMDSNYARRCVFNVFGKDKIEQFGIALGQELTISFDIDAREYNGRWYNTIRAWRVVPAAQNYAPSPQSQPGVIPSPVQAVENSMSNGSQPSVSNTMSADTVDDLPF